ncbi:Lrp/AsnC family transcriptional regulator [Aerococcus christensenii]|uniref:Lrp/AsnC family transcriptional regulator n=1 Tax=Aerococcus christensenii TaxID=87541 RepID=A0A2I1K8X1_9LACT|nr:Lrp/AsnC family transcriptional regulator [Aerococcus christensenii]PKY92076.1 Lrp/AsnC family transcriptional regulator [Aerococcus christensenii]WEB70793.1 Lrp/AsnC family transcriptional regulator [Aerococcus christensenii]
MDNEKRYELLRLLEEDASIKVETLAALMQEAPRTIEEELDHLHQEGILSGTQAMVNWDATDNEQVSAVVEVSVNLHKEVTYQRVAESIYRFEEVEAMYLMSGAYDYLLITKRLPMHAISRFINKLATLDEVSGTSTHIVMQRYKDHGTIFKAPTDDRLVISR